MKAQPWRQQSLGRRILSSFLTALLIAAIFAVFISGSLIKRNFDESANQSARLVSTFIGKALAQHLEKLTSGLAAMHQDTELVRDLLSSLSAPEPRRSNFFSYLTKLEDLGKQYQLQQLSIYLQTGSAAEPQLFGRIDFSAKHVFSYDPAHPSRRLLAISRDEYGLVNVDESGPDNYAFPYNQDFLGTATAITLAEKDGLMYLDVNYPLVSTLSGRPEIYSVVRAVLPLPSTFIADLEATTKHQVSFYSTDLNYLQGLIRPEREALSLGDGFLSEGSDNRQYINYLSTIEYAGAPLGAIIVSFPREILFAKILHMSALILAANFALSAMVIVSLSLSLRRRVLQPITRLTRCMQQFTGGDFSTWRTISLPAADMMRPDELSILSLSFRSMGQQIYELVNHLEDKVRERTAEIIAAKQQTQDILNHIGEGILSFDASLQIGSEYSKHLPEILGVDAEDLRHCQLDTLLFQPQSLASDQHSYYCELLRNCLDSPYAWELNAANLPRQISYQRGAQQCHLSLEWYSMLRSDLDVSRGMLVIRDVTETLRLEAKLAEATLRQADLQELLPLMSQHPPGEMQQFFAARIMRFSQQDLRGTTELMLQLHTLKGEARTLGLNRLATQTHALESLLLALPHEQLAVQSDLLTRELADLVRSLRAYEQLLDQLLHPEGHKTPSLASWIHRQAQAANRRLEAEGLRLASFHFDDHVPRWHDWPLAAIQEMILHALTNAVDHGYLLPLQEGRLGRQRQAAISICTSIDALGSLVLQVRNDGAPFAWGRLRSRLGLSPETSESEILEHLLASGVSTATSLSMTSGRGIGLSAVLASARSYGGIAQLLSVEPRGAELHVVLPPPQAKSS